MTINSRKRLIFLFGIGIGITLLAQYSTPRDVQVKDEMRTFVEFMVGNQNYILVNNQKHRLPQDLIRKRAYWQKELSRGRKGEKPAADDSTSTIIPIAEAVSLNDKYLEFTHWSPVYNLGKVWGGRVEFKKNDTVYEATYFWHNGKLLDITIRPFRETLPGTNSLLNLR